MKKVFFNLECWIVFVPGVLVSFVSFKNAEINSDHKGPQSIKCILFFAKIQLNVIDLTVIYTRLIINRLQMLLDKV